MTEFALQYPLSTCVISLCTILCIYSIAQSIVEAVTNIKIAKYTGKLPGEEEENE